METLTTSEEELAGLDRVLADLKSYDAAIREIQAAKEEGRMDDVPTLSSRVTLYANDLELEIDQALRRSEYRITNSNQEAIATARSRLLTFQWAYLALLILAILIGFVLERSITRPVSASARRGAEDFRVERQPTNIVEIGNDELTSLARSFNQLTRELVLAVPKSGATGSRSYPGFECQFSGIPTAHLHPGSSNTGCLGGR